MNNQQSGDIKMNWDKKLPTIYFWLQWQKINTSYGKSKRKEQIYVIIKEAIVLS